MEIKVNVRLKLGSGVFLGPGVYNDNKKPFHPKVYGEIIWGRPTVTLLSGSVEEAEEKASLPKGKVIKASVTEETTMKDVGSPLDTETSSPKTSRRTKK